MPMIFFFCGQLLFDVGVDFLFVADLLEHVDHAFVRAAVQADLSSVPMAEVIAEYMSLNVEIVTRALKVDAFMP